MTTATPDVDILADVDASHTPVCQVLVCYYGTAPYFPCDREAIWAARITCCQFSLLVCHHHHDSPSPWSCRKCGADLPDSAIGWVKL